ncbi:MAG: hypothetical protein ABIM41_04445 [candidate division WOR-3 bacterium]
MCAIFIVTHALLNTLQWAKIIVDLSGIGYLVWVAVVVIRCLLSRKNLLLFINMKFLCQMIRYLLSRKNFALIKRIITNICVIIIIIIINIIFSISIPLLLLLLPCLSIKLFKTCYEQLLIFISLVEIICFFILTIIFHPVRIVAEGK